MDPVVHAHNSKPLFSIICTIAIRFVILQACFLTAPSKLAIVRHVRWVNLL